MSIYLILPTFNWNVLSSKMCVRMRLSRIVYSFVMLMLVIKLIRHIHFL